ncbi:MAG: ribonuclease III [Deltaproteobacteria bacterium]|jgi:ribonuclease-3|nr:ribonuclease III [Deltaproteobacteria bacterium]
MAKLFPDKKILAKLKMLQERLDYRFRDISFLCIALTHRSFLNENPQLLATDNERLEFLGDAVLSLVISDLLCKNYPEFTEGTLSKIRAALVNEKTLAKIACNLNIGECLLLGHGEEKSGGRNKHSLLANALEAVVAAIYLDSDFKKVNNIVIKLVEPVLNDEKLNEHYFDYKSALQELCQKAFKINPVYSVMGSFGPEHDITFKVSLTVPGIITETGSGKNIKDAEKNAAWKAWKLLQVKKRKLLQGKK